VPTLSPALAVALFVAIAMPAVAQRDFPANATIRGENIWLRVDPAEDTEVIAYLQRGDRIRVTGDTTAADGDAFYPVKVIETGETGWVRELAVDPRSLAPVATLPEVVIDEPSAEADSGKPDRQNTSSRNAKKESAGAISLQGVGTDVSRSFTLAPGRYRVAASIRPSEGDNFIVHLVGPGGTTKSFYSTKF
jgi:hypothetical protein